MPVAMFLVVIILNLVPADVTTFTMESDAEIVIRLIKQADGGWQAIALPDEDMGTFHVDGTTLTFKGEGQAFTRDTASILGLGKETDWATLTEAKLGDAPVQIERKKDGLDLIIKAQVNDQPATHTLKVRWSKAAPEPDTQPQ